MVFESDLWLCHRSRVLFEPLLSLHLLAASAVCMHACNGPIHTMHTRQQLSAGEGPDGA